MAQMAPVSSLASGSGDCLPSGRPPPELSSRTIRIALVTDLNVYGEGYARLRAMEALGCRVSALSMVPIGGAEYGYTRASLVARIAWKLGFQLDTVRVQAALLAGVAVRPPDIIWIDKGNMFRPGTLKRLRQAAPQAVLVSYSGDDMFARHNRTWFYRFGLKHYDVVFTTKSFNANPRELPSFGPRRVIFVNNAYSHTHHPVEVTEADRQRLGAEVGFIGSFEQPRLDAVSFLAEHGIPVRVWGSGWPAATNTPPQLRLERHNLVNTEQDLAFTKSICSTRINLGFLRKVNRDQQTARSVEIPACGGFMLAERTEEHLRLFTEGKEAEYFSSQQEMLEKVRYYLAHEAERAAIAAAGYRRCLESGYGQVERMRWMLDEALRAKSVGSNSVSGA